MRGQCQGLVLGTGPAVSPNGRTEGPNLIVEVVKRSGFGSRNFQHYRLRVLYRCS